MKAKQQYYKCTTCHTDIHKNDICYLTVSSPGTARKFCQGCFQLAQQNNADKVRQDLVDKLEKCRAELQEVNDRLCCEIAERALLEEEVSGLRGKNREVMAELASFEAMNRHKQYFSPFISTFSALQSLYKTPLIAQSRELPSLNLTFFQAQQQILSTLQSTFKSILESHCCGLQNFSQKHFDKACQQVILIEKLKQQQGELLAGVLGQEDIQKSLAVIKRKFREKEAEREEWWDCLKRVEGVRDGERVGDLSGIGVVEEDRADYWDGEAIEALEAMNFRKKEVVWQECYTLQPEKESENSDWIME